MGQWPANPLGIFDLSNNVKEWVNDWYSSDYYSKSPELNPKGPESGKEKVYRGDDKTIDRGHSVPQLDGYHYYGIRCSLQQSTQQLQ
ncbi:formylglycine-generating enzyme family protein [Vibrio aerogenes]|uniref:formylglycine-generating enzyme family protein n=1 Tax=Vibrio aerogenes TaxID=92172 RepID=UPI00351FD0B6